MTAKNREEPETHKITEILVRMKNRPELFNEELIPIVYTALHRMAHNRMKGERPEATMQPTELVSDAYIRLVKSGLPDWQNRFHFYACASKAMRRILIEAARKRNAIIRGGGVKPEVPDDIVDPKRLSYETILTVDIALDRLEAIDPVKARIFELRFFSGMTMQEIADGLGIGLTTANKHYRLALAWLKRDIKDQT